MNLNHNDDNWTMFDSPVYKHQIQINNNESHDNAEEFPKDKKIKGGVRILSPVITLQLIICLSALTLSFLLNSFFSEKFNNLKEKYDKEIYSSMFFDGKLEELDYSDFFNYD